MRVSLLTFDFGESVVPLASQLASRAAVQLLIPDQELEPFRAQLHPAVSLRAFAKPRLRQAFRQLRTMRQLVRSIEEFSPDVLHLQQGHLWFNFFLSALRQYPLVVTVHDPSPHLGDRGGQNTPRPAMEIAFRRARVIITHASYVAARLTERGVTAPEVLRVVPLAFPSDPRPVPNANVIPTILFFGRIWPYKGLEYLIRAEPLIRDRVPQVQIVIAGRGEPLEKYRMMAARPETFRFEPGYISLSRREQLFDEAWLVVLPYVEATQTGVIPLAYRHGKAVVATMVGGLPEVVQTGRTGELVPARDPTALADAVAKILLDHQLRARMGAAALDFFESHFDADTIGHQTMSAYEQAIDQPSKRRKPPRVLNRT